MATISMNATFSAIKASFFGILYSVMTSPNSRCGFHVPIRKLFFYVNRSRVNTSTTKSSKKKITGVRSEGTAWNIINNLTGKKKR